MNVNALVTKVTPFSFTDASGRVIAGRTIELYEKGFGVLPASIERDDMSLQIAEGDILTGTVAAIRTRVGQNGQATYKVSLAGVQKGMLGTPATAVNTPATSTAPTPATSTARP